MRRRVGVCAWRVSDRGVSRRWRIGRRDRAAGKLGDQKSAAHWLRPSPRTLQCDVGAQPAGKLSERKIIRRVEAGDEIARCTGMGRDSSAVNDEEGVARGESRPRGLWQLSVLAALSALRPACSSYLH